MARSRSRLLHDWMPPGITTDKDYVIAQYDGAINHMDACIQTIFDLRSARLLDGNVVSDHGEICDHECWFRPSMASTTMAARAWLSAIGAMPKPYHLVANQHQTDRVPTIPGA